MDRDPFRDELMLSLGEMKGDIKALLADKKGQGDRLDNHDRSIRSLQMWQDTATGKLAIIGAAFTFLAAFVGAWINRKFF
jgi:hypothetical protein